MSAEEQGNVVPVDIVYVGARGCGLSTTIAGLRGSAGGGEDALPAAAPGDTETLDLTMGVRPGWSLAIGVRTVPDNHERGSSGARALVEADAIVVVVDRRPTGLVGTKRVVDALLGDLQLSGGGDAVARIVAQLNFSDAEDAATPEACLATLGLEDASFFETVAAYDVGIVDCFKEACRIAVQRFSAREAAVRQSPSAPRG